MSPDLSPSRTFAALILLFFLPHLPAPSIQALQTRRRHSRFSTRPSRSSMPTKARAACLRWPWYAKQPPCSIRLISGPGCLFARMRECARICARSAKEIMKPMQPIDPECCFELSPFLHVEYLCYIKPSRDLHEKDLPACGINDTLRRPDGLASPAC